MTNLLKKKTVPLYLSSPLAIFKHWRERKKVLKTFNYNKKGIHSAYVQNRKVEEWGPFQLFEKKNDENKMYQSVTKPR